VVVPNVRTSLARPPQGPVGARTPRPCPVDVHPRAHPVDRVHGVPYRARVGGVATGRLSSACSPRARRQQFEVPVNALVMISASSPAPIGLRPSTARATAPSYTGVGAIFIIPRRWAAAHELIRNQRY
jgi:hypothetical protein